MDKTVTELRDQLNELIENGLGHAELRFAYQANYPLQDHVGGIWYDEEAVEELNTEEKEGEGLTVYLVSGGQDHDEPYGPREAFANCM